MAHTDRDGNNEFSPDLTSTGQTNASESICSTDERSPRTQEYISIRKAFRAFISSSELEEKLEQLNLDELKELSSKVVAAMCLRRQQEHLQEFKDTFVEHVDEQFQNTSGPLLQSFLRLVSGLQLQISEQSYDSCSSSEGTVTISMPGLPEGANVTRSRETFFVHDGRTLIERNEVRVKMGGLDVYSGYWLAADSPISSLADPVHEEGIDTLRRVMEAAGIEFASGIYEEALQYPFLCAMLAPFGPEAICEFEEHVKRLHKACSQKHGGRWFRLNAQPSLKSSKLRMGMLESGTSLGTENGDADVRIVPRSQLTPAEEADIELSKLDLRAEGLILTHEEARSKLLLWARQELAYESVINSSVLLMHDW